MQRPEERPVVMAAITGAHGIGGEVRLKLFCASVDGLKRHRQFMVGDRTVTLEQVRAGGQGAVARLAEVRDRSAAERLRGSLLCVPRASLPPLAPGEYYWHDLIGLPVVGADGAALGHVASVENYGASDLIDVERPDGSRVLVPLIAEAATVEDGRVLVEAGWI